MMVSKKLLIGPFTLLEIAIFMTTSCGAVGAVAPVGVVVSDKKLFNVSELFNYNPVKCLPRAEQLTIDSIRKQDKCEVQKSAGKFVLTPNSESVCNENCVKKSELLVKRFNGLLTECIDLIHDLYYGESDEKTKLKNNKVLKLVPSSLKSDCAKNGPKYRCNCSFKVTLYGSENAKTIIRRFFQELKKQKSEDIDEIFFNSEYLQHLYKKYKFKQNLIPITNVKADGKNGGNQKGQKKSIALQKKSVALQKKSVTIAAIANSGHKLQRRHKMLRYLGHGLIVFGTLCLIALCTFFRKFENADAPYSMIVIGLGWIVLLVTDIKEHFC